MSALYNCVAENKCVDTDDFLPLELFHSARYSCVPASVGWCTVTVAQMRWKWWKMAGILLMFPNFVHETLKISTHNPRLLSPILNKFPYFFPRISCNSIASKSQVFEKFNPPVLLKRNNWMICFDTVCKVLNNASFTLNQLFRCSNAQTASIKR